LTDDKIRAILNKIREDGNLSYKNAVPKLNEGDLLNVYGASILGNMYVKNQFLDVFMNYFMYEETKQHIFESEFDRLKRPVDMVRYGTFEAFRNTIKPMEYDEEALDRILKTYKPDVKTAYFARNRQDIFPMSVTEEELEGAFADYDKFRSFVRGLYDTLVQSNKVVEYNAIKECINVNVNGGAIKTVSIPTITSSNAHSIAKMIRSYVTKMTKPSTQFNAYADLEGAVGDPVETNTPKMSLLLIANADTIAELSVDVLASAFNLAYADFQINLIEVDDFGYNVYDRTRRKVLERKGSNIQFMICDEALFKFDEMLNAQFDGKNNAALLRQVFYHIWQGINVRPWANAVAFVTENSQSITTTNNIAQFGSPAVLNYTPDTVIGTIAEGGITVCGTNGNVIESGETGVGATVAKLLTDDYYENYFTIADDSNNSIVSITRNTNGAIATGEFGTNPDDFEVTQQELDAFFAQAGNKPYWNIKVQSSTNANVYETIIVPMVSKETWNV
jgi:hypothetical protein